MDNMVRNQPWCLTHGVAWRPQNGLQDNALLGPIGEAELDVMVGVCVPRLTLSHFRIQHYHHAVKHPSIAHALSSPPHAIYHS